MIHRFEQSGDDHLAAMFEGRKFNHAREGTYEYHEVTIRQPDGSVKYLDDYTPGEAVVSRKTTQFADVTEDRARAIIREFAHKHPTQNPDFTIADTPANRAAFSSAPHLVGTPLDGSMILEVPVQTRAVPPSVREYAAARGVVIHDTSGTVLNQAELDAHVTDVFGSDFE
ncbi:hypothetical protein [Cellulomonas xiejunii]|uniref:Uncharacterized protein n=1 Tax=Cellulomonas xiejunii TaxID=2968083 RepID=A0ABY5KQF6_9CELL|nr:hypothetical protein [Cellulomonas xiejunii]MCC2322617.1 hypothetical protein [Cellulomonas xiejunii]UUI72650.1 hypothetical protein NP048_04105 [Cellulomonas xiejunii]